METARLPMIPVDADVPEGTRAVFQAFVRERGGVPNLFRIAALRPPIVETLQAHLRAVMGPGEVDVLLKELVACRVSQVNGCEYCLASHGKLARRFGGNEGQIAALAAEDYTSFAPGWAAAFAYATEVAGPGGCVTDATFAALSEYWSAPQIVEITAVAAVFSLFNRFANALQIPITL